jgi:hypothetical protein
MFLYYDNTSTTSANLKPAPPLLITTLVILWVLIIEFGDELIILA